MGWFAELLNLPSSLKTLRSVQVKQREAIMANQAKINELAQRLGEVSASIRADMDELRAQVARGEELDFSALEAHINELSGDVQAPLEEEADTEAAGEAADSGADAGDAQPDSGGDSDFTESPGEISGEPGDEDSPNSV